MPWRVLRGTGSNDPGRSRLLTPAVFTPALQVIGIWFFEPEDCTRITELLQRISKLVTPGQGRISPEPSSATKTGSNYEPGLRRTGSDGNGPAPAPAPAPAAAAKEPAPSDRARLSQMFANLKVQKAPGQEQAPPEPAPEPVESKPKPATAAPQLLNPALLLRGAPLAAGVPASGVSGKALAPKQSAKCAGWVAVPFVRQCVLLFWVEVSSRR